MHETNETAKAWLGLGSNQGELLLNLTRATLQLSRLPGSSLLGVSSIYESAPVGAGYSQAFYNAVIALRTELSPLDLLHRCLDIEVTFGRVVREGDRPLDIDVLLFDDMVLNSRELTLPHPRMHERRFVLEPLAELDDSLTIPQQGLTVKKLLECEDIQKQEIRRLEQPLLPAWGC